MVFGFRSESEKKKEGKKEEKDRRRREELFFLSPPIFLSLSSPAQNPFFPDFESHHSSTTYDIGRRTEEGVREKRSAIRLSTAPAARKTTK